MEAAGGSPRGGLGRADAARALALLVLCAANIALDPGLRQNGLAVPVGVTAALASAVAVCRRLPERALLLGFAVVVVQIAWEDELPAAALAAYVIVGTVAARGAQWAVRLALYGGLAATAVAAAREADGPAPALQSALVLAAPFTLSWALGYRARFRRCHRAQLAERDAVLGRLRAARRGAAVAAQRVRICQEMLDITGHRVAGMVVQAEAADRVLDVAPGRAREVLTDIAGCARESETDLRRTSDLLRGRD
ncbi:histidine kinase dimerization/phosphoacceptor domain-containing protein [Streptomyces specialis]|uniref:histidine kinase dimerization/phosphoacceptor domain-containing protein n=1 Tax=Streptomyces specialis TaxID=498367 RepID=UPI00073EA191|nr:histidine kinase dimerization/phosphoacceptor domain-containing protein [Streptomyces specialis]